MRETPVVSKIRGKRVSSMPSRSRVDSCRAIAAAQAWRRAAGPDGSGRRSTRALARARSRWRKKAPHTPGEVCAGRVGGHPWSRRREGRPSRRFGPASRRIPAGTWGIPAVRGGHRRQRPSCLASGGPARRDPLGDPLHFLPEAALAVDRPAAEAVSVEADLEQPLGALLAGGLASPCTTANRSGRPGESPDSRASSSLEALAHATVWSTLRRCRSSGASGRVQ